MSSQDETRAFKRSERVTLALLGGAGLAAIALAEVDPTQRLEDIRIYPTAEACIAGRVRTPADCATAYEAARRVAAETAPRYPTMPDCEAQHGLGECLPQPASSPGEVGRFAPAMAAYLVGITARQNLDPQPLFRAASEIRGLGAIAPPAYRTSWGCPVSPADRSVGSARVPAASVRPALFGGFGGTGRAICGDESASSGGG